MHKKIEELADGYRGDIIVLITNMNRGVTAKGAPYLSFTFQDKTGNIVAKYWNVTEEMIDKFQPGMLVQVFGDALLHQKQLQFRVTKMETVNEGDIDVTEFVRSAAIPKEQLYADVQAALQSIENPIIHDIVETMLQQNEKAFFEFPAASKNHHDFAGGLAMHVCGMIQLAKQLCILYPMLHHDVLIGGVILHDLGKVFELSGAIATEYTMQGKLLGHISIAQAQVAQVAQALGYGDCEEVILLRHMILSHHGDYAYGSPVLPLIPEAEMLHLIDNIDARMNTLDKALHNVEPGDFTQRIFALENRNFYKGIR